MTLAFIVHLYIYVVRDFFFSPNRVEDCCVKLDKMSHCCSFDTSLSKTTTRGNYIIILLLGMTSYYHVLTIWPLVALYLKVNALHYKRIDRVQKRCIRSEANTTNVELLPFTVIWQRALLTLSSRSELLCPLSENDDKSVWLINKRKTRGTRSRGCKWWLELPLCAVNVHHFFVFFHFFSLSFGYEYDY